MATTEVKVPAILVPGSGGYFAKSDALWDVALGKKQSQINQEVNEVLGMKETLEQLEITGQASHASEVIITSISGLQAANVQQALAELMEGKAAAEPTVYHGPTLEVLPKPGLITADVALVAYSDSEGHDLSQLHKSIQDNVKAIQRVLDRMAEDKENYIPRYIDNDVVIFAEEQELVRFSRRYVQFRRLYVGDKEVLTEHQDISGKADIEKDGHSVLYEGDVYSKQEVYTKQEIEAKRYISENNLGEDLNELVEGLGLLICSTPAEAEEKNIAVIKSQTYKIGLSYKVQFTYANTADNVTVMMINQQGMPMFFEGARVSSTNSWEDGDILELWTDGQNVYSKLWLGSTDKTWYGTPQEYQALVDNNLTKEGVEYNIYEE